MKLITRELLRYHNACYTDEKIAKLVPPEGLTLLEVLRRKDIPDADKVWVSTRPSVLTSGVLIAFSKGCAERAAGYADVAADAYRALSTTRAAYRAANTAANAAAHATLSTLSALSALSAAAYVARDAAERSAQVKHLTELLEKEGET